jgi:hypothetical protein
MLLSADRTAVGRCLGSKLIANPNRISWIRGDAYYHRESETVATHLDELLNHYCGKSRPRKIAPLHSDLSSERRFNPNRISHSVLSSTHALVPGNLICTEKAVGWPIAAAIVPARFWRNDAPVNIRGGQHRFAAASAIKDITHSPAPKIRLPQLAVVNEGLCSP